MFKEIIEHQQLKFYAKQSVLAEAIANDFKGLIDRIPSIPNMSYGLPPYIVDDGSDALFVVDAGGGHSRLPADFRLSEESVDENYDAIYSIPVKGVGLVRLIPANKHYQFDALASSSAAHPADDDFYESMDNVFQRYIDAVIALAREHAAGKLMSIKGPMLQLCDENDIEFKDVLATPGLVRSLFSAFGEALSEASAKIIEDTEASDSQAEDDKE